MLTDLGLWRPGMMCPINLSSTMLILGMKFSATIFFAGEYYPVSIMQNVEDLIKQAPAYWTREQARREVRQVAVEYTKRWLPGTYQRIYAKHG